MSTIPISLLRQETLDDVGAFWANMLGVFSVRPPQTEDGLVLQDLLMENIPSYWHGSLSSQPLPDSADICWWILLDSMDPFYRYDCGPEHHRDVFLTVLNYMLNPRLATGQALTSLRDRLVSSRAVEHMAHVRHMLPHVVLGHTVDAAMWGRGCQKHYWNGGGFSEDHVVRASIRYHMYEKFVNHGLLPDRRSVIAYRYPHYYAEIDTP